MRKAETTNTFSQGLVMDFNPLVTPNNTLSNALNATLITKNGNENVLQNDMGNGRVETAYLPEGYIPVGTTQLGGIIYVVSYNPILNQCQIGSFPSPERNISTSEIRNQDQVTLGSTNFVTENVITNVISKQKLANVTLHAGDKYIVAANSISKNIDQITGITSNTPRYISFHLATMDDNGRLVRLTTSNKYLVKTGSGYYYFMYDGPITDDLSSYRNAVQSPYQIFTSKIAGELYLVAELELIDTFSVTYRCEGFSQATIDGVEGRLYKINFAITTTPVDSTYIKGIQLKHYFSNFINRYEISDTTLNNIFYGNSSGQITTNFESQEEGNNLLLETWIMQNNDEIGTEQFTFTPVMPFGIYEALSQTISINFKLVGTGVAEITRWKYYKEDNQIKLNWEIDAYPKDNEEIVGIDFYAWEFNEDIKLDISDGYTSFKTAHEDKIFLRKENQSSYSGGYVDNIQFGKLKPNTLYFVLIATYYSEKTRSDYSWQRNMKCLYTNGIFNDVYISDPSVIDYDLIKPELSYVSNFSSKESIYLNNRSQEYYALTSLNEMNNEYIRGADVNHYKGNIDLTLQLDFQNNYNTFKPNPNSYTLNITDYNTTINKTAKIISTRELIDDSWLNLESQVVDNISDLKIDNFKDQLHSAVNNSNGIITIQYDGIVYNKITANHSTKNISLVNYIAPLVYNSETAAKYNLRYVPSSDLTTGHFEFENNYLCLGMSAGGSDNNGGGGTFFRVGSRSIVLGTDSTNQVGYGETIVASPSNQDGMDIDSLPYLSVERSIMTYLSNNINIPDSTILPLMWVRVGGNDNDVFGTINGNYMFSITTSNDSTNGNYLLTNGTNGHYYVPGMGGRGNFTKSYTDCSYLFFQFIMKDSQGNLHTTNNYFAVRNQEGQIKSNRTNWNSSLNSNKFPNNYYLGDVLASLLCQLYVKQDSIVKSGEAVNDISYYSSLKEDWSTQINYQVSMSDNSSDSVLFNGVTMSEIQSRFISFITQDQKLTDIDAEPITKNGCLSLNCNSLDNNLSYTYTYSINLDKPELVALYTSIQTNPRLENYVESITGDEIIIPDSLGEISSSTIYYVNNNQLTNNNNFNGALKMVNGFSMNSIIQANLTDENLLDSSVTKDMFSYTRGYLTLNNISNQVYQMRCDPSSGGSDMTGTEYSVAFNNNKIFSNCNIVQ